MELKQQRIKKKKSKGGLVNRRVQRPPFLSEIQVALEVSGTQPQMNYSAGLFSERKNNNNGYAYVGKSVGLGVSGKASSNATERGSKRAAALIISGAEAHSATCSPYAHRCSFSKV